jgi:hypothetical protein
MLRNRSRTRYGLALCGAALLALGLAGSAAAATPDSDGDGIPDTVDNCLLVANPDQADANANAKGDVCECGDATGDGRVDVVDASHGYSVKSG